MNPGQKQYGLIKSVKTSQPSSAKPSIFNNSSSDDESAPPDSWGQAALKSISHGSVQAAQTRKVIRQAMQEDASLFQYDEVYDNMQQQKQKKVDTKKTEDKKPRYMQKLLQSAEQRRHQQERRVERQVQRERDEEGDEFADKEQFVTEAYRQRLIQRKQEEEQERRIRHIEELNDVTKQKDLGSFYRHMYQRSSGGTEPEIKQEPRETPEPSPVVKTGSAPAAVVKTEPGLEGGRAGRRYRPRRASSSPEPEPAGGDRSRSRSRSPGRTGAVGRPADRRRPEAGGDRDDSGSEEDSDSAADSGSEAPQPPPPPPRPRASSTERAARRRALYDKRTVGDAFEAARQRYLERRAARLNGPCPVPAEA